VVFENPSMIFWYYPTNPKKLRLLVTLAGVSKLSTFWVLLEPTNIPSSKTDVTQESHLLHPKLPHVYLDVQSRVLKLLRYQMEMFFTLEVNQYTIDEHYDKLVQIFHKDLAHQIHKVGRNFNQSKMHHRLLVWTIPQNEGRLWKVTFLYHQLILSRSHIDFREHTHTMELIK
jgi:hypothetical protein